MVGVLRHCIKTFGCLEDFLGIRSLKIGVGLKGQVYLGHKTNWEDGMMIKAIRTYLKKWGFFKKVKKVHLMSGVLALAGLSMMFFYQNCGNTEQFTGNASESAIAHLESVSNASSGSQSSKLLYSLLLLEGHTVELNFCDANRPSDNSWSCSGDSESECVNDCGGTFIDTGDELKALSYFCFPPFTNHSNASDFKNFRNGHLCNTLKRGQWIATQTLKENGFVWDCDSQNCTLKYKPNFQIHLGFCRRADKERVACIDQDSCTNRCKTSWVDTESELRQMTYFCIPSDFSTTNSDGEYEKARNRQDCHKIEGAQWTKIIQDKQISWSCDLTTNYCKPKEGFLFKLDFCRLKAPNGSLCEDRESCANVCRTTWVDTQPELEALKWLCLPPDVSSSNIRQPRFGKIRGRHNCTSQGGVWTRMNKNYQWICDDNDWCLVREPGSSGGGSLTIQQSVGGGEANIAMRGVTGSEVRQGITQSAGVQSGASNLTNTGFQSISLKGVGWVGHACRELYDYKPGKTWGTSEDANQTFPVDPTPCEDQIAEMQANGNSCWEDGACTGPNPSIHQHEKDNISQYGDCYCHNICDCIKTFSYDYAPPTTTTTLMAPTSSTTTTITSTTTTTLPANHYHIWDIGYTGKDCKDLYQKNGWNWGGAGWKTGEAHRTLHVPESCQQYVEPLEEHGYDCQPDGWCAGVRSRAWNDDSGDCYCHHLCRCLLGRTPYPSPTTTTTPVPTPVKCPTVKLVISSVKHVPIPKCDTLLSSMGKNRTNFSYPAGIVDLEIPSTCYSTLSKLHRNGNQYSCRNPNVTEVCTEDSNNKCVCDNLCGCIMENSCDNSSPYIIPSPVPTTTTTTTTIPVDMNFKKITLKNMGWVGKHCRTLYNYKPNKTWGTQKDATQTWDIKPAFCWDQILNIRKHDYNCWNSKTNKCIGSKPRTHEQEKNDKSPHYGDTYGDCACHEICDCIESFSEYTLPTTTTTTTTNPNCSTVKLVIPSVKHVPIPKCDTLLSSMGKNRTNFSYPAGIVDLEVSTTCYSTLNKLYSNGNQYRCRNPNVTEVCTEDSNNKCVCDNLCGCILENPNPCN